MYCGDLGERISIHHALLTQQLTHNFPKTFTSKNYPPEDYFCCIAPDPTQQEFCHALGMLKAIIADDLQQLANLTKAA